MKLSIAARGRNDNYGSKTYISRTSYCIRRFALTFKEIGLTTDDIEIVFTDWGSGIPIHTVMADSLGYVRYIIVPPELANESNPPETGFDFVKSINTSLVRCKGDNVLHTDMDHYIEVECMRMLWKYLDSDNCKKYQNYFPRFRMDDDEFIKIYRRHTDDIYYRIRVRKDVDVIMDNNLNFGGRHGGLMVPKKLWHDVSGYDERLIYWGIQDWDIFSRMYSLGYKGYDMLKKEGIRLIHIDHRRYNQVHNDTNKVNPILPPILNPAGKNWGFKNMKLEEVIK